MRLALGLLALSCSAPQEPTCNDVKRSELTAMLLGELVACGKDEACIDRAAARHIERRAAWVNCGGRP